MTRTNDNERYAYVRAESMAVRTAVQSSQDSLASEQSVLLSLLRKLQFEPVSISHTKNSTNLHC